MLDIFLYSFILRGFAVGIIIAVIAPLIGIFLVLRRYSLIADTLSHVSLAGIAVGLFLKINPLLTALVSTVVSSLVIDRLRTGKKIYGESALAIFLSGSLAAAVVIVSLAGGLSSNLLNYLFGSISTVTQNDLYIVAILGVVIVVLILGFFKELIFISFDEEAAKVAGIRVRFINSLLTTLTALTISLAIPIIGVLLISALIVVPVVTALQFRKSFLSTVLIAECVSVISVISGIFFSFYFNLSTGGTVVLIAVGLFAASYIYNTLRK